MSDQDQQQEPSMEEILASIRRIISEDGEERSEAEVAPKPEPEPEPELEPEAEPMPDPDLEQEATAPTDEDVLELTDEIVEEEPAAEAVPPSDAQSLVSPATEAAAASAFAALASARPETAGIAIGDGSRTLEDMVKELLRPMLKEWLDQNLPRLVERLVEAEIRRLSGGPRN